MHQLGIVNSRKIYYTNVIRDLEWFKKLPVGNWCAFTITDDDDSDFIELVVENHLKIKSLIFVALAN